MLGGCVYEQSASREAQEGGSPGRLAPPPRSTARPPMQAMAPPQPDRVRGEDLSRLSPGTGIAGPEAEPAPLTRRTPYPSRIYVQAASFVTRAQAERARRSIAGLGPSGVYTAYVDDQLRYRVRIGPLRTPERSESVRAALVRRGYGDAIIVRD
jgi:cell division protein FtsN